MLVDLHLEGLEAFEGRGILQPCLQWRWLYTVTLAEWTLRLYQLCCRASTPSGTCVVHDRANSSSVNCWKRLLYSATATKSKIDPTQFSQMERQSVEVWFCFQRNYFFSFWRSAEKRENHIERDREKWRHKDFWRQKHGLPADVDVDIAIVRGARAGAEASVTGGLRAQVAASSWNATRVRGHAIKFIATASDTKEGG